MTSNKFCDFLTPLCHTNMFLFPLEVRIFAFSHELNFARPTSWDHTWSVGYIGLCISYPSWAFQTMIGSPWIKAVRKKETERRDSNLGPPQHDMDMKTTWPIVKDPFCCSPAKWAWVHFWNEIITRLFMQKMSEDKFRCPSS